eukprot:SAG22_NODE_2120_length_2981_cov_1.324080_3_plen_88_part_00
MRRREAGAGTDLYMAELQVDLVQQCSPVRVQREAAYERLEARGCILWHWPLRRRSRLSAAGVAGLLAGARRCSKQRLARAAWWRRAQ